MEFALIVGLLTNDYFFVGEDTNKEQDRALQTKRVNFNKS